MGFAPAHKSNVSGEIVARVERVMAEVRLKRDIYPLIEGMKVNQIKKQGRRQSQTHKVLNCAEALVTKIN